MSFRRIAAFPAVLAFALFSGCGGGAEEDNAATGTAGLVKAGQLQICTDGEYPPISYLERGDAKDLKGFDADTARAVAEKFDVTPVFKITAFDGLVPALDAKRCDLMFPVYITPERLKVTDGIPTLKSGFALGVKAGSNIKAEVDLPGKTISTQSSSEAEKVLKELNKKFESKDLPPMKIQAYPKVSETVGAVVSGKADAVIETDVALVPIVEKSNGAISLADDIFPANSEFGFFLRKDSPLTAQVERALNELAEERTSLANKYGLNPDNVLPN